METFTCTAAAASRCCRRCEQGHQEQQRQICGEDVDNDDDSEDVGQGQSRHTDVARVDEHRHDDAAVDDCARADDLRRRAGDQFDLLNIRGTCV
jgi:hypothetical protein